MTSTYEQAQKLDRRGWPDTLEMIFQEMREKDARIAELEAQPALTAEVNELLSLLEGYIAEKEAQMRAGYRYGEGLTRIVELYRAVRPREKGAGAA